MVEGFASDAEMEFRVCRRAFAAVRGARDRRGLPRATAGRRVARPRAAQSDGRIEARYAWLAEPEVAAGEMFLTPEDGAIRKLVGSP
jgi:hypothetical protein